MKKKIKIAGGNFESWEFRHGDQYGQSYRQVFNVLLGQKSRFLRVIEPLGVHSECLLSGNWPLFVLETDDDAVY